MFCPRSYIYLYVHIVSSPNKQTTAAEENKRTGKLLESKDHKIQVNQLFDLLYGFG